MRQAITDTNADASVDTATFTAGLSGTIPLTFAALVISDDVTIDGPGAGALAIPRFWLTQEVEPCGNRQFPGRRDAGTLRGTLSSFQAAVTSWIRAPVALGDNDQNGAASESLAWPRRSAGGRTGAVVAPWIERARCR